jgi:predicted acetyltransferase
VPDLAIDPIAPDELAEFRAVAEHAFGGPPRPEEEELDRRLLELDRTLLARAAGTPVGTTAALSFQVAVPGAVLPMAGITSVAVAPAYRRRGVLSALMRRQLGELREPAAVLWSSESGIYGRFGYGLAARQLSVRASRRLAGLRPDLPVEPTEVVVQPPAEALPDLVAVHESEFGRRPGAIRRDDRWWQARLFDPPGRRDGRGPLLAAVVRRGGRPDGYALYATRPRWDDDGICDGEVEVDELLALHPVGQAALWRYLTSLDLFERVQVGRLAPDDPLPMLLAEPRHLRARLRDSLWCRLVDVPAALAGRRYRCEVDVVLEVTDRLLADNDGRWRLSGDRTGARCEPTGQPADLAMDVEALGAGYLGGTSLNALADAGRVRELRPGRLAAAAVAFEADRLPQCQQMF